MKRMSKEDELLYELLKDNQECRDSNWECIRRYYKSVYGLDLPAMEGIKNPSTVERQIRLFKSEFKECRDQKSDALKAAKEAEIKESVLDKNKFIKNVRY